MRRGLLLLGMALLAARLWGGPSPQPDLYSSETEKSPAPVNAVTRQWREKEMRETQEKYALKVTLPAATAEIPDPELIAEEKAALRAEQQAWTQSDYQNLALGGLLFLAVIMAYRKLAPLAAEFLNTRYNPWLSVVLAGNAANVLAEEKTFAEFLTAFRIGPAPLPRGATETIRRNISPLDEFFARVPKHLATLRSLLQQVKPGGELEARKKNLEELRRELRLLKGMAGLPEVLPVWQLAFAIEGLLTQLTGKAQSLTLSTLRTIAQAIDLMEILAVPGLKADLATNPPIRLLAVDDDPISRHAVSFALKKALNQPDLAPSGPDALPLIAANLYDVIFLDVQMPGMDGFELCSKIHEGGLNQKTPVVFVTCQSDFEARAKSTLAGGHDLMGKPFLTFEITVKALTLVLRGRLDRRADKPVVHTAPVVAKTEVPAKAPAIAKPEPTVVAAPLVAVPAPEPEKLVKPSRRKRKSKSETKREQLERKRRPKTKISIAQPPSATTAVPQTQSAMVHASPATDYIRKQLSELTSATSSAAERQELLAQLCLGIHSLTSDADRQKLSPAFRISTTLQSLLKKIVTEPKRASASTLHTAGEAIALLDDLRKATRKPDLAVPPVHIMIVDDDPMARRAITGAIQLSFGKPDSVESGEAALAIATEKEFDLIFLDVRMPGMDGFEACRRIHETTTNRQTPVVFVTSHSETELPRPAAHGGCGFIPKPAYAIEVTLAALTFTLRNRLERMPKPDSNGAAPLATQKPVSSQSPVASAPQTSAPTATPADPKSPADTKEPKRAEPKTPELVC